MHYSKLIKFSSSVTTMSVEPSQGITKSATEHSIVCEVHVPVRLSEFLFASNGELESALQSCVEAQVVMDEDSTAMEEDDTTTSTLARKQWLRR